MEIGIITPVKYLEDFAAISNYHLVLAHMVDQNEEYRNFYRKMSDRGDYITLDNSSFEVGDGVYTPKDLVGFAKAVGATEVMAPEEYLDGRKTVDRFREFMSDLTDPSLKVFGTIHGKTIAEISLCHDYLIQLGADTIGLSCRYNPEMISVSGQLKHPSKSFSAGLCRAQIMAKLSLHDHIRYHLLGLNHPLELSFYEHIPNVKSNDSSCAFIHGMEGTNIQSVDFEKSPDKLDFEMSDDLDSVTVEQIYYNINFIQHLAGYRSKK